MRSRSAYQYWGIAAAFVLLSGASAPPLLSGSPIARHPLTIDDVLATERLDQATLSPDGEWVAAVVQRGAKDGEVYGRNAYETDPSRNDVVLISTKTGERRAITSGASQAAGYWCAAWSPDGQQLAMLSTQPKGNEPRGGDNVRLYVWTRASGRLTRMGDTSLMTQTRYGSGLYKLDLRGGADGSAALHSCGENDENAPFAWLDDHRLLTVAIPKGQTSGLIDHYGRPFRQMAQDARRLHDGREATVSAVGSGAERLNPETTASQGILRIVDTADGTAQDLATIPAYPFRGALSVTVSPDRQHLAVMATTGALQPQAGHVFPHFADDGWTVERRLGFIDLTGHPAIRWAALPAQLRYPLELYSWSPDSRHIALRGRSDRFSSNAQLFVVAARNGDAQPLGPGDVAHVGVATSREEAPVVWADGSHLIARLNKADESKERVDWWLLGLDGRSTNLTGAMKGVPEAFRRAVDGHLVALCKDELIRLDLGRRTLVPVAKLGGEARIVAPLDPGQPTEHLLVSIRQGDGPASLQQVSVRTGVAGAPWPAPARADLVSADAERGQMLFAKSDRTGVNLNEVRLAEGRSHDLLTLDAQMSTIDWGHTQLIDYLGSDGTRLKGAVILPPDYQRGRRYPTLAWIYPGYHVGDLDDYFLDPFLPGIYNLQLYAACGYVVLIPTMPLPKREGRNDVYTPVYKELMPAIERLVAMGIADPDRLGVMGQSGGGYDVYALVTQTNRFKAAAAFAGITDLTSHYGQFAPMARGYPGIEHEMSDNWAEIDIFGRHASPFADPAGYAFNSPLSHADKVSTPLLMVHGDMDMRGASGQAEEFFYALYDQGKTAKLLRYGGESHSLAQSPANVRDIFTQTIDWFDRYVKAKPEPVSASNWATR